MLELPQSFPRSGILSECTFNSSPKFCVYILYFLAVYTEFGIVSKHEPA